VFKPLTGPIILPCLNGFEKVNRYWDPENQIVAAKIMPGELYVTKENELITTVLGSCIAACVRDKELNIGGMNHFMLPETSENKLTRGIDAVVGNAMRYGNYAMEHLINSILAHGGKRKNLEVKLFGGGKIIPTLSDVGMRNITFVLEYIETESLTLLAQDLGDIYPRKVNFYPMTGRVRMKKISDLHNQTIVTREFEYRKKIKDVPIESEIELF